MKEVVKNNLFVKLFLSLSPLLILGFDYVFLNNVMNKLDQMLNITKRP
jgi:hypothetical protein